LIAKLRTIKNITNKLLTTDGGRRSRSNLMRYFMFTAPRERHVLLVSPHAGRMLQQLDYLINLEWKLSSVSVDEKASKRSDRNEPELAMIDLTLCNTPSAYEQYRKMLQKPGTVWVAVVNHEQLQDSVICSFIHDYCSDYVRDLDDKDSVASVLFHANGMAKLKNMGQNTVNEPGEYGMIGASLIMKQLYKQIKKVAWADAPVYISGETGTGKELTARAIHAMTARKDKPFSAINCGAIPPHLIQSELFGYERGAFTGANQRKIGRIEAADGGTLFLDEIGDLPLESQVSLLRFLQQGTIERLGGHESILVNVRIISATHVDLFTATEQGKFRLDMYHRLCVLKINQPRLCDRESDIELLANAALKEFAAANRRKIHGFTPCAIRALYSYNWPGNVRELINKVQRAVVMSEGRVISADDLQLTGITDASISLDHARADAERMVIERALLRNRNRLNDAAKDLGISRVTLYRLTGRLGMRDRLDEADLA
jgi:DNA-binding NtrC family response regulator